MAQLITDPEQLLVMNMQIKRKLRISDKSFPSIIDYKGRKIEAIPLGFPQVISVSEVEFPFGRNPNYPKLDNKPFFFNFDGQVYALDRNETSLLLGTDYRPSDDILELNATLEACTSGPGLANAYVLGGSHHGISKERDYVVIPVQYYKIEEKTHKLLSAECSCKDGLEHRVDLLRLAQVS